MSQSVSLAVGVAAVVVVAFLAALAWRFYYLRSMRRRLTWLFGRREAVRSALRSLGELLGRLVEADKESWSVFVSDQDSEDRRALAELRHRMEIVGNELKSQPMPRELWGVADRMARVAGRVAGESARVGEAPDAEAVLEALKRIDYVEVAEGFKRASTELEVLIRKYGVKDVTLYGGGLYI